MAAKAKVLFIGLDSAEPALLREWSGSGVMPVLQSLRATSVWGPVAALPGFSHGAIWPSLFTGVNPAGHGRYFSRQIKPGKYDFYKFDETEHLKREPFWNVLSRAGRRVAIIDVARAPLTNDLNGIELVEWITADATRPPRSWPPELVTEVTGRFGCNPLMEDIDAPGKSTTRYSEMCRLMLERIRKKTELCREHLEQGGWDLYMTDFADPHDVGHHCWHFHDPTHPLHDAEFAGVHGDPVKDIYVATDAAIGQLMECAGPEATVIVYTGPGMEARYTASYLLDEILRRLEPGPAKARLTALGAMKAVYRRLFPRALRKKMRRLAAQTEKTIAQSGPGSRKCFAVPHAENSGAIRINLVGREPNGRIKPGAECDAFCAALTRELLGLVNCETGGRVVKEVLRVADVYPGEFVNDLPDLLVVWDRSAPIRAVKSPKIGRVEAADPSCRTGDHTTAGLFFVRGAGIRPRELDQPVSVMDLAPTIAQLLGETLRGVEGTPIEAVCATGGRAEPVGAA